jgi:hypothetical protein
MYSPGRAAVNVPSAILLGLVLAAGSIGAGLPRSSPWLAAGAADAPAHDPVDDGAGNETCDPAFARLFTPAQPRVGRYEVCPIPQPLTTLAEPGWRIEAATPLDAFGAAGSYNRAALSRLYGGRRVDVAHGWRRAGREFESLTLISPYPDPALSRLEPGTLIIRLILCCT